jgi:cell division cycle 14
VRFVKNEVKSRTSRRKRTLMKRKRAISKMEDFSNVLVNTGEFIPGRLYFVTLNTDVSPKSTSCVHYFAVDTEQCYDSFYNDFGPLNLAILFHYCGKLDRKLSNATLHNKKIVHYTGLNDKNRVNAAFLIGAYAVIKLDFDPEQAYQVLTKGSKKDYIEFRDASIGDPYTLSLLDCLKAVKKALECGFFDFNNFDFFEYEHYERVENGDLNWIIPEKFIAFCGPHHKSAIDRGYPIHSPETYFAYFRRHNVTTVIRLNKKAYDSNRFVQAGFDHKDLFFIDGGIPNDRILNKFISVCESAKGAIAVHCKAGLGRTGTLIACYIMKHYKFTAQEAIAWIRICRPGSIIAHQQTWLLQKQKQLWAAGDEYRQKMKMNGPIKHAVGIYGLPSVNNNKSKTSDNVTGIMKKVDSMEINDKDEDFKSEENKITQGDRLNEIKAQRAKAKQPLVTNL